MNIIKEYRKGFENGFSFKRITSFIIGRYRYRISTKLTDTNYWFYTHTMFYFHKLRFACNKRFVAIGFITIKIKEVR